MSRRDAPATHRNRDPILDVLSRWLTKPARVLELASGTGQHAVYFAKNLPHLSWQPSDGDPAALESIASWVQDEALQNVMVPVQIDASAPIWPIETEAQAAQETLRFDAVFNANMIHISPWRVAEGLMLGAGRVLSDDGLLFLYGPFKVSLKDTSPSNAAFDADLRRRNPEWGVRDMAAVEELALREGLRLVEVNDLPANNKLIVFRRGGSAG